MLSLPLVDVTKGWIPLVETVFDRLTVIEFDTYAQYVIPRAAISIVIANISVIPCGNDDDNPLCLFSCDGSFTMYQQRKMDTRPTRRIGTPCSSKQLQGWLAVRSDR